MRSIDSTAWKRIAGTSATDVLDKVGDSWNRDHDPQKTRVFVTAAIAIGQNINKYMSAYRGRDDPGSQWTAVRAELNRLAQTFNLPAIRW